MAYDIIGYFSNTNIGYIIITTKYFSDKNDICRYFSYFL